MADSLVTPTRYRGAIQILIALTLANLLGYAARNALFSAYADLRLRFPVDDADLGLLTTAFMLGQAIITVPVGWAGDRFGRKPVIAAGLAMAGAAGLAGALSNGLLMLVISRVFVGVGCAVIVPISNSVLSQLFDGPQKASRIAVFNLGMFVGGGVGFALGATPGYPTVLLLIGAPTIALALYLSRLAIPAVDVHADAQPLARGIGAVFIGVGRVMRRPALPWLLAAATAMSFAAGGLQAWLVEFLKREKHLTEKQAQGLLAAALVAGLAGVIVGARVGDRWRRSARAGRVTSIALAMGLAAPMLAVCIVIPPGPGLYIGGVVGMFFLSWYHAPLAATVHDLVPPEQSVMAQAVVIFAMHSIGTAPASWIVGIISKYNNLTFAMWVPTSAIAVAALLMMVTARVMRNAPAV